MPSGNKCPLSKGKNTYVNPGTSYALTTTWTNQTWLSSWSRRRSASWKNPKPFLPGSSRTGYENSRADPATNQLHPTATGCTGALPAYLLSVVDGRDGLPTAGNDATEDSRVLPGSDMNPTTTDEYDWGDSRTNPLEPMTFQDAFQTVRWSNEWQGNS